MDLSFNLAPSYRDLKDPTTRQNFEDTPGQIPKLILTLRLKIYWPAVEEVLKKGGQPSRQCHPPLQVKHKYKDCDGSLPGFYCYCLKLCGCTKVTLYEAS